MAANRTSIKRQATEPVERRNSERRLSIKRGVIAFEAECAVLDESKQGAKLLLRSKVDLPEEFTIAVGGGGSRPCRVAWRNNQEYGIEFLDTKTVRKEMKQDARHAPREKIFDKAMIVYNDGFCTMDCKVVDYSPEGARLQPLRPSDCPIYFQIRIKHGPTRNCMVLRRTGRELGVRFLPD